MNQVLINGVYYPIHSPIITRRINPWKAQLGSGSLVYSDFQNAELEEYFDFRNGIGKQRGLGSDARVYWSEGIDFTTEGQTVLGALDTTAGSFGVAPVKIIDFQSGTYAIGTSLISKWNTSTSAWDSVDTSLASPIDAIVLTDDTDEYLVVSSATSAIYTTDGSSWSTLVSWKTPDSVTDTSSVWTDEALAIDGSTATFAYQSVAQNTYSGYLQFNLTTAIYTDSIRIFADAADGGNLTADIDFYYNGAWNNVSEGTIAQDAWVTKTHTSKNLVSKARVRLKHDWGGGVQNVELNEFAFQGQVLGYLADFENRLYGITTDGQYVLYSTAKNIDDIAGSFSLTGNFGTVYDFFEGKLLADGTPTLYFCGTQGLYSLDTTNEIAYKQEVSYPPITNAGNVGIYWNANVWVSTGYGILKVAPSVATYVGPDLDDGLPSGYQGKVYDFATVNNWLVFCVNGGSTDKSSILKRNSTLGGNLQVYTTASTNKPIACMHHSPSSLYTNGRLWFGEGTDVKYMMFPDTTSNVKQIATYTYLNDSGYGQLPIFRKLAAISKTALGVAAITKSCSATDYIQVFYGLNGAAATTSLGTFITSPKPTALTFASGLGTAFYTIQFAIKLFQGATSTNSPELESLMFYYIPTPGTILSWAFRIACTDENSAETIVALEAIRDTNTLVPFYPSGDPNKTSFNVKLTQLSERVMYEEQGAKQGYLDIQIEEVFKG
uniref:Uncharacterized protein n=1 Tax=viral metagenome TaxID=1070528 RepID=A0A6M3K386_9ZZZZ